jgi:4-amino-4-deoxy-L-arabinose transferase-like glycosyltransferase
MQGTTPASGGGPPSPAERRRDLTLLALLYLALVVPYALGHVDDVDSVTYRVITRHLLEDGTPFRLRFLSTWLPRFTEHPPFMFWVWAAATRLMGEWSLPWIAVLCGLGTTLATYLGGVPLVGRRAAFLGGAFLCATESFFRTHANVTLDPPLTLAFVGSTLLLLNARGRWSWLVAGGLAAGVGALVKGPPAWGAPFAAWLGLLMNRRDEAAPRRWIPVVALAIAPLAAFFLYDRLALDGLWWNGYVLGQLGGTLSGANLDGHTERFYLLETAIRRFPHGVPFLLAALALALPRSRRARLGPRLALLAWAAVVVGGYSIPRRAWPWYLLPAYPAMALLAGAGLDDLLALALARGDAAFRWMRRLVGAASAATLALLPACSSITGRRPLGIGPCTFGPTLPAAAAAIAPDRLALVAADVWHTTKNEVFVLADHTRRDVVGLDALSARPDLDVAVVRTDLSPLPRGWTVVAEHERWALVRRSSESASR